MTDNPVYPYSSIARRAPLTLPDGKRLAVWIGVANAHFSRVGIWRLMELFDRYRVPVTSLLNRAVAAEHPDIVTQGVRRGRAFVGHGATNSTFLVGLTRDRERAEIARITDRIAAATGTRPRGWSGRALTETEHTPDVLVELPYTYTLNWGIDDEPVRLTSGLTSVPYSADVNDLPAFVLHHHTAAEFRDMLIDRFDQHLAEEESRPRVMGFRNPPVPGRSALSRAPLRDRGRAHDEPPRPGVVHHRRRRRGLVRVLREPNVGQK